MVIVEESDPFTLSDDVILSETIVLKLATVAYNTTTAVAEKLSPTANNHDKVIDFAALMVTVSPAIGLGTSAILQEQE